MTRIFLRRFALPVALHLALMGALAAPLPAAAMQILDAADHAELSAEISATDVNRIALAGDRIARIVRAPDGFAVEHDAASGDLYLRPAVSASSGAAAVDPVTLFVGTEGGFTYRLTLTPAMRGSAQILIRNAGAMPDAAVRAASPGGGAHVAALVKLVRAVARREPLPGCSTGHIGDSWQCPLAAGGSCDSVAAADPAVPDAKATQGTVLAEPLWRVRAAEADTFEETPPAREPAPDAIRGPAQACATDCGAGFDPFAWLARLFAAEAREGETPPGGKADAPAAPAAPLPAEPAAAENGPQAGDLRTGEVVARIWIAPFVDADGVYREASHVRVVLEPAGWRLK